MMRLASIAACVALSFGSLAHAQPRRPPPDTAAPADGDPADTAERREKLKKRIRAIRDAKLMEELPLDGQTTGRLLSVLDRYDDETYKLLAKRVEIQRKLRHADSMKDPKAIDRLIDDAIANQRAFWDLDEHRVAELRKILTPAQAAKLLVVLPELERKIQNQLRNAITQRRAGGAGGRGGGAGGRGGAADSDDDLEPDELPPPNPQRPQPRRREAPLPAKSSPSNAPGNTPPCDSSQPCH